MKTYAIVASLFPPHVGGVERYSYNLAKKLTEHGNRVIVITSGAGEVKEEGGIKVYYLPSFLLLNGRLPIIKPGSKFRGLENILKTENVDYFIINTRFYSLSLWAAKFAYAEKKSAILIEHGSSHLTFNNKYLDIFVRFYEHAMTMLIKKYPMRYFGVSKDACEWIKHFNIQAEGTLYNAMNLDEIDLMNKFDYRKKLGLTENDFIITYVGRIVGGKGLLELTSAVNEIRKEYSNVYLVVAGDGPYMKELVKHKTPYITLLGRIPYSDVISLLSSVDTFCLPSETEGFPTSVLEAVACKCYVITTTAGGSKELITNSQLGTIMKDNSSKSIEEALRAIIDHKESRIEASEKCYVRLKEKFTWDAVAAKVEDIFEI